MSEAPLYADVVGWVTGDLLGVAPCSNFHLNHFDVGIHVGRLSGASARAISDRKMLNGSTQAQLAWVLPLSACSIGHREGEVPLHSSSSDSAGGVLQDLCRTFFKLETFFTKCKRLQFHGRLMTRNHQLFSGSAFPIEHIPLIPACFSHS